MLVGLTTGDSPAPWVALGFEVPVRVGPVDVACDGAGGGARGWTLAGAGSGPVDGIPTRWVGEDGGRREGSRALDHVVVLTDSLERTVDALVAAGGVERRRAVLHAPMSWVRLGPVVEVVERAEVTGARIWGLVAVVDDLGALPPALVGEPRDAVQPGRRIVTARRVPGLDTALAFMTPRVRTPLPEAGRPG